MSTSAYEGGIGGKFRKRPFRRAAATPYDRPPSAARGLRDLPWTEAGSNGWLSKLVDPASRFIAGSASRLFSSFIGKRLTAPPAVAEENHQSRQEVSEVACINPSSELQDQRGKGVNYSTNNSDTDGISDLEQLLKQKTFTRVEVDQLTELLRSRTVEPVKLEPATNIVKKENKDAPSREHKASKSRLYENFLTPAGNLTIPKDEAASPVELAKAYMGSMPSKVSPSTTSLRTQVFQEDADLSSIVPFVPKLSNQSVAPRSVVCFSGIPELPENGYGTPKPRGRSAMCRLSCSPYFKVHPTTNVKDRMLNADGYTGPSSSHLKPGNIMHSGGRQVLKRGSSVLDSDFGSIGPIRRIRQKTYFVSPSKDRHSTPLNKYVCKGSTSVRKPSMLDEPKYGYTGLHDAENGERKIHYASVAAIPPKSTETAMKILEQLDNLVASPKEKSSEPKAISKDESSCELTHNMLGGQTSRSMEDKDSSVRGNGSLDASSDSKLLSLGNSLSKDTNMVEGNGKSAVSGVKLTWEDNAAVPSTVGKLGTRPTDSVISDSAALCPQENVAFQMSASEDSLASNDDRYNPRDAFGQLSTGTHKVNSKISKQKTAISETTISEKSLMSSSKSVPISSPISSKEADMKASGGPAVYTGFTFPVAPASSTHSLPPPLPTMPIPSLDRSALLKEQTAAPVSSSNAAGTLSFSSALASINDTAGQKNGASDASTASAMEGSALDKGGKMPKVGDLSKSFGSTAFSGISVSTTSVFGFGGSIATSQSNGSLYASSLTIPVCAAPPVPLSDSRAGSIFPTSTATSTSTSTPSISPAPISSTVNNSQNSTATFGVAAGSIFGTQSTQSGSGTPNLAQSSASQFGTLSSPPTFGLSTPFSSGFGSSPFGSATFGTKPFMGSGFPFSGGSGSSSADASSSFASAAAATLFSSTSQPSTPPVFGFVAGSTTPSLSTGFSSGPSSSASVGSSAFGSAMGSVFSFTSAGSTAPLASSPSQPLFGMPRPAVGFSSGYPGNDQMNVEDSMADEAAAPMVSTFGQPANLPATPNSMFGSAVVPSGGQPVFQFGGHQNPSIPQSQSPFEAGNLEVPLGGSFSLGSGGGDKSSRRFIRVKRDKQRKR